MGCWDGASATEPAYQAVGSTFPHGQGSSSLQLDEVQSRIGEQVEATNPDLIARYQRDLNQLFERTRSSSRHKRSISGKH